MPKTYLAEVKIPREPHWMSTDGVPHFGVWYEGTMCACKKSTHQLKKQYHTPDSNLSIYITPEESDVKKSKS